VPPNTTPMAEVWQRGPIPDVPPLLQPVAHALLQSMEEIDAMMQQVPENLLWKRPGNIASIGFHLKHIRGVLDRLFTYANESVLSDDQLRYLANESIDEGESVGKLLDDLHHQINLSIAGLKTMDEARLTELRFVGRKRVESTMIGLLVHSAEHTMRHTGQCLVTVQWLLHEQQPNA
jgi:uncharacterized damage-inducible protein DinB